jgi:AraC-like DNA-binding protein
MAHSLLDLPELSHHTWKVQSAIFQPFPMLQGHRAQVWRHQPSYWRPRHFHDEPELNIVLRGSALMGVGGHTIEMQRGDVLFLRPGQDHEMLRASDDLDLYVTAITPDLAERCVGRRIPTEPTPFTLGERDAARLGEHLSAFDGWGDTSAYESVVGELFSTMAGKSGAGHPVARVALRALYEDPNLQAGRLAAKLRVHPSELSRHFHRDVGLPFVRARARLRLMRFIRLVDAKTPLTRAASEAGFGSYAQCHRVFVEHLSCSPSDYFSGRRDEIGSLLRLVDSSGDGKMLAADERAPSPRLNPSSGLLGQAR